MEAWKASWVISHGHPGILSDKNQRLSSTIKVLAACHTCGIEQFPCARKRNPSFLARQFVKVYRGVNLDDLRRLLKRRKKMTIENKYPKSELD
jgi:hypothetical protein